MIDVEATLHEAVEHHREGRPVDAHRLYKRVLAEIPDEPDALHLLGMLTFDNGNPKGAADLIRRAIAGRPGIVDFHLNLSRVCRAAKQWDEAVSALQRAIEINPLTPAETHRELAETLVAAGRHADAIAPLEQAVALTPTAESLGLLGELLSVAGRLPDAYRATLRAVQLKPDWAPTHAVLGAIQDRQGDLSAAEASYRRALELDRNSADVCNNLGSVVLRLNRPGEAAELFRRAVQLRPTFPQAHNNLGRAFTLLDRLDDAIPSFRAAAQQAPNFPEAWDGLGWALLKKQQWGEASVALRHAVDLKPTVATCLDLALATGAVENMDGSLDALRQAIQLDPKSAEAFHQFGVGLRWSGQVDDSIAVLRRALELDPHHAAAHSALLYSLLTHDRTSASEAFAEHVAWGRQHADPIERLPALGNDLGLVDALIPGPRKLRVGYISNTFKSSAVMAFIAPILANHDRSAVEVICYSDATVSDDVTAAARRSVDLWRRTATLTDAQLAQQIRDDRIDVLVELTGHLGNGRLLALARRPAPVQISYLGYQGTTGVSAVDYVLTDDFTDPPGAEMVYVEQPWRLPRPFFCWRLPTDAPDVGPLPMDRAGFVTFGCLNAVAKATPAAVALWGRVLSAVPDSRMVMMTTKCRDTDTRLRVGFANAGVNPARVRFVGRVFREEYMARYNAIDVALDPIPFVGHTTTLDAAWMGCPTVTRSGDGYAQRYGGSALRAIGLADLVAESDDAYVRTAERLATDSARLANIRAGLRQAVTASPIADAVGFTRDLEAAYRQMMDLRR
jgi:predicted O-linked N-acetylglucosamine transferase (SPINDLY family)